MERLLGEKALALQDVVRFRGGAGKHRVDRGIVFGQGGVAIGAAELGGKPRQNLFDRADGR